MNQENKELKNINKKIDVVLKKMNKTKSIKINSQKVSTLKELENIEKIERRNQLIFLIQSYIADEKRGVASLTKYADVAKIHRLTFKKYVQYYKESSTLPTNGNRGRTPANKITDSVMLKIVKATERHLDKVEKYAKELVPTSWALLYYKVMPVVNKKDPKTKISLSTFKRRLKAIDLNVEIKYETKLGRKIRRRIKCLTKRLEELELLKSKVNVSFREEAIKNKILSPENQSSKEVVKEKSISKRRNQDKPGVRIQWDGSMDTIKNGEHITRMQAIDHNTLSTMGLSFVKNENNKGFQMLLSQIIDNCGIPEEIMGDLRKGVDTADKGAKHAILCKLLGITLNLDSNSIHKAELESLNGKMHPFITYHCAEKNIKTIKELNKDSGELIKESNKFFKRKENDYSHLRQATEEMKEIIRGEIKQVYIKTPDGISLYKKIYEAIDNDGKRIELEKFTWAIVSIVEGIAKKIWTDKGIFRLNQLSRELNFSIYSAEKIFNISEKYFIDNGAMIMNRESYEVLCIEMKAIGYRESVNHHLWKMDEQIKERISKLQEIARQK